MGTNANQNSSGRHAVFAYGTLKHGFANHYFFRDARFLGKAKTVVRYSLYVDEYPLVYPGQPVSRIVGEVYQVDNALLSRLDMLEGHPRLYRREQIEVILASGERLRAWIYFFPEPRGRLIPSGEFKPTTALGSE